MKITRAQAIGLYSIAMGSVVGSELEIVEGLNLVGFGVEVRSEGAEALNAKWFVQRDGKCMRYGREVRVPMDAPKELGDLP